MVPGQSRKTDLTIIQGKDNPWPRIHKGRILGGLRDGRSYGLVPLMSFSDFLSVRSQPGCICWMENTVFFMQIWSRMRASQCFLVVEVPGERGSPGRDGPLEAVFTSTVMTGM